MRRKQTTKLPPKHISNILTHSQLILYDEQKNTLVIMKKQQLRERTLADISKSKQLTLDRLPEQKAKPAMHRNEKSIEIFQLEYAIKESDLELTVAFRLFPSKNSFSNLTLELHFDEANLQSYLIGVPPSQLLSDVLEFPIDLDIKGISPGPHTVKVELYERWETGEKLTTASRYVIVDYSPTRREDRYVKVPIVRKIDGAFRIILPNEKEFYEQLERDHHKEQKSKRDYW